MHISFLKTYFAHILNKNDIHSIKNAICHVCLKVTKYVYLRKCKCEWFTDSLHFRLLFYLPKQSRRWLERSPCNRKCLNPSRDRSKFAKTGSDSSNAKRSELDLSVKNSRKCQVTQYVWLKNLTARRPYVPSKVKNLQLFTGNDDISK